MGEWVTGSRGKCEIERVREWDNGGGGGLG